MRKSSRFDEEDGADMGAWAEAWASRGMRSEAFVHGVWDYARNYPEDFTTLFQLEVLVRCVSMTLHGKLPPEEEELLQAFADRMNELDKESKD
jgi:hypothetical protein